MQNAAVIAAVLHLYVGPCPRRTAIRCEAVSRAHDVVDLTRSLPDAQALECLALTFSALPMTWLPACGEQFRLDLGGATGHDDLGIGVPGAFGWPAATAHRFRRHGTRIDDDRIRSPASDVLAHQLRSQAFQRQPGL